MRTLLVALLLTLPAGPAAAQGAATANCAALFDAAGTRVGRVHGGIPTWVYFDVNQLATLLQVSPAGDELRGTATTLYFTDVEFEPTCTGTAHVASDGPPPAWLGTAVVDRTVYVRDPDVDGELLVARSQLSTDTGLCTRLTQSLSLAPAFTFTEALPAFVPPFHVEPESCMIGVTAPALSIPHRIALALGIGAAAAWLVRRRRRPVGAPG